MTRLDRHHQSGEDEPREPHRLGDIARRILAHSPDPEKRLTQRLAEQRRELDEHTGRIEDSLEDLERREQLLRDARASVERLLRVGTNELEARESDLAKLVSELEEREARLHEEEAELARRRSELGAVELKRAALDQRERALAAREARVAPLEKRFDEVGSVSSSDDASAAGEPATILVFVPGPGYSLVELEHPAVSPGELIDVGDEKYVVARVGPSPLPGDRRRCAYLAWGAPGGAPSDGSS